MENLIRDVSVKGHTGEIFPTQANGFGKGISLPNSGIVWEEKVFPENFNYKLGLTMMWGQNSQSLWSENPHAEN